MITHRLFSDLEDLAGKVDGIPDYSGVVGHQPGGEVGAGVQPLGGLLHHTPALPAAHRRGVDLRRPCAPLLAATARPTDTTHGPHPACNIYVCCDIVLQI